VAAGLERHQAGRRDQAERLYAEALARDPEEATALYLLGLLAFETDRPNEAAILLQRVSDLRPRNLDAQVTLASVRHWLGERDAAAQAYRQALAIDPDHVGALVGLANVLREARDFEPALQAARDAVARHPDLSAVQAAFAATLGAAGQPLAAASAYREAIRLEPDATRFHVDLALVLIEAGDPEAAVRAADRAMALDPGLADACFARGAACAALHQPALAASALERATYLDPRRASAHLALAGAYAELERAADAEASLKNAIAIDPMMSEAHASLGAVYLMADRPQAARACYEMALAIDPDMVVAHQNLAALLAEAGDLEQARRHRDLAYGRQNLFVEPATHPDRRVLILTTAEGGNVPFRHLLPKDRYTRINWFVEYAQPGQAATLPDYDVVFNAIGDSDLAGPTRFNVEAFLSVCRRPVINDPVKVAATARQLTPALLGDLADVVAPPTLRVAAEAVGEGGLAAVLADAGLTLPVLARPIGSHGGKGLVLVETPQDLAAVAPGPGGETYLTAYRDFRSPDGFYRKYRMIFVDGQVYPYHLAISRLWLVHHGTADMAADPQRIAEELSFLQNPQAAIGARALAAVRAIGERLGLDYAGIDFSVLPDGQALVFEANATMLVHPEPADGPFAHKNAYVQTILGAFQALIARR
jgi:tetratricopeptide (TPR) repeat protein